MGGYIDWDGTKFVATKKRPNGHISEAVLDSMLDELRVRGPITPIEEQILDILTTHPTVPGNRRLAKVLTLKKRKLAVCHKIPISKFKVAIAELLNQQLGFNPSSGSSADLKRAWDCLSALLFSLQNITPAGMFSSGAMPHQLVKDMQAAFKIGNGTAILAASNNIIAEFDKFHKNLFFGHSGTNSSIGAHSDFHFDLLATSVGSGYAVTPRGPAFEDCLNRLEFALGYPIGNITMPYQDLSIVGVVFLASSTRPGNQLRSDGHQALSASHSAAIGGAYIEVDRLTYP